MCFFHFNTRSTRHQNELLRVIPYLPLLTNKSRKSCQCESTQNSLSETNKSLFQQITRKKKSSASLLLNSPWCFKTQINSMWHDGCLFILCIFSQTACRDEHSHECPKAASLYCKVTTMWWKGPLGADRRGHVQLCRSTSAASGFGPATTFRHPSCLPLSLSLLPSMKMARTWCTKWGTICSSICHCL